ncbi:MAG TPA: DUF1800 domain-containing protein [Arenibacter sp.]|nr:DUF1800 domain-containing protein [Arenibacter sp.]
MEYFINCNTSSLAIYGPPLDSPRAAHLYRRLGLSASVQTIDQATGQSANALVNSLIAEARNMPPLPAPAWANWNNSNYPADDEQGNEIKNAQIEEWGTTYTRSILNNDLRDRLSFFWSNHLVTKLEVYNCTGFLYEYINCLQRHAIGNFKTMVSEIGRTSAMLYFLDGAYSNGDNPNENYARELYELFTMGEGIGYTEEDIIETAKALTGYVERGEIGCTKVLFDPTKSNTDAKTIFGRTGNWDYDDVMDILFEERADEIGYFICKKLYEFFVHPDSTDDDNNAKEIIDGLSATFVSNNFELAPVLGQLFKSQHFFDEEAIGVIIKSPFDVFLNLINETNFAYDDSIIRQVVENSRLLGQELFNPFDVNGWQRNRTWINTHFMIGRWLTCEFILEQFWGNDQEQFRAFAVAAVGPGNSGTSNPRTVVQAVVNKLLPKGLLTEQDFNNALDVFMIGDVPENYYGSDFIPDGQGIWWLDQSPEPPIQIYLLLLHLVRQPEFQLK